MLKLYIDNSWEPNDFVELMQCTESMYYKLYAPRRYRSFFRYSPFFEPDLFLDRRPTYGQSYEETLDRMNRALCEQARFESSGPERLIVKSIRYSSPGGVDLLGLGKACESIANAVGKIVSYYDDRHLRRERNKQASIQTEQKRVEVERDSESLKSLKIQNARAMLELERDFPDEARDVLLPLLVRDQDALSDLIADGRLIGADTKKEK